MTSRKNCDWLILRIIFFRFCLVSPFVGVCDSVHDHFFGCDGDSGFHSRHRVDLVGEVNAVGIHEVDFEDATSQIGPELNESTLAKCGLLCPSVDAVFEGLCEHEGDL